MVTSCHATQATFPIHGEGGFLSNEHLIDRQKLGRGSMLLNLEYLDTNASEVTKAKLRKGNDILTASQSPLSSTWYEAFLFSGLYADVFNPKEMQIQVLTPYEILMHKNASICRSSVVLEQRTDALTIMDAPYSLNM